MVKEYVVEIWKKRIKQEDLERVIEINHECLDRRCRKRETLGLTEMAGIMFYQNELT